ncbi:TetR/AcrR family transcriptional regulator [Actinocorallia sp. B10E7]|uniref:TetR/AcrR family transcriptional regulator n=1 Tax=Actinocorallia sp. B10E7 TaxID=3153558 RepID=UPI00325E524F
MDEQGAGMSDRDRVIVLARRLFAQLGYDATTLGMISEASGIDSQRLHELVGGKQDLYLIVLTELFAEQNTRLAEAVTAFDPEAPGNEGFHGLIDAFFDFALEHPELPALLTHRWLADAADLKATVDERFSRPLIKGMSDTMRLTVREDLDLDLAMWTMLWSICGFINIGLTDAEGVHHDPHDRATRERFRRYLYEMIDRLL